MRQDNGEIDVTQLIDACGLNRFNLRLTVIAFLVVVVEGYDITALAFAAPGLMKSWHITNAAALGPLLTASMLGMLIGSPLFGYLGDRFGRRWTTILACVVFGVFTALVLAADSINQIFVLRMLAGLGLGGAAPNVIALVSEYAPTRRRAMMVTIMFSGIGLGGAIPGFLSSLLMVRYGWEALFWIGTVSAIAVALVCFIWLPESAKYLVARSRPREAYRILRVLAPDHLPVAQQPLVLAHEPVLHGAGVTQLFRNGYGTLTIFFWIVMAASYMTFNSLQAWMPAVLGMAHFPAHQAALALSMFQLGGVTGGVVLGRLLDRRGPSAMTLLLVLAIPATVGVGLFAGMGRPELLLAAEFAAGFCILGTAYGLGAFSAMLYQTSIRANGSGWALGLGRLGAIVGAIGSGKLIGLGFDVGALFVVAAIPLVIATAACFVLARLYKAWSGASGASRLFTWDVELASL